MFFSGSCGCPIWKLLTAQRNPRPQSFCISVLAIIVFSQSCVRVHGHAHINFSIHQTSYRIHSYHSHLPAISFLLPGIPACRQAGNLYPGLRRPLYYPLYYETNISNTLFVFQVDRPASFWSLLESLPASTEPVSIVLRDQLHYLINPDTFELKIFTAMASKTTPKNFRTAVNPAGPSNFAMYFNE